jgi:hypothetical protein
MASVMPVSAVTAVGRIGRPGSRSQLEGFVDREDPPIAGEVERHHRELHDFVRRRIRASGLDVEEDAPPRRGAVASQFEFFISSGGFVFVSFAWTQ